MAETLETSEFTSVQRRVSSKRLPQFYSKQGGDWLRPIRLLLLDRLD